MELARFGVIVGQVNANFDVKTLNISDLCKSNKLKVNFQENIQI